MHDPKKPLDLSRSQRDQLLLAAVANVQDYAIFVLDAEGRVLTWNQGAERIKGYRESEIVGQHFSVFYTEEDLSRNHPAEELRIAREVGKFEEEGWRSRKDGTRFWANVLITTLRDDTGAVLGFSKVTRDLTERRAASQALRLSEERFRQLVDSVKDYAIFLLDATGRVATWNAGAERLKGYTPPEIIGQHFSVFYPQDDIDAGKCEYELEEASLTGRFEDEGWRLRKDGTRFWANVVITALRDSVGRVTGFSKVTRDLTERRRAEQSLRRANTSLEKRVRTRTEELSRAKVELERALVVRDEFLSIASHELKTPITSLKLHAQLLESKFAPQATTAPPVDKVRHSLRAIVRQTDRLTALIEHMLDVSRAQLGKFTFDFVTSDVSELTRHAALPWQSLIAQMGGNLTLDIESDVTGEVDPIRYEQVVTNLLSNAQKYAPASAVHLVLKRGAEQIVLQVSDKGPGIDPHRLDRIFERYERAADLPGVSGFGLGLYITQTILEGHGGRISAHSTLGHGTSFIVSFPLHPPRGENTPPPTDSEGSL